MSNYLIDCEWDGLVHSLVHVLKPELGTRFFLRFTLALLRSLAELFALALSRSFLGLKFCAFAFALSRSLIFRALFSRS
jgi:hypothetical protein